MLIDEIVEMESGLLLPEYAAEQYYKDTRRPKCIDLFAGCGGMSLGSIRAGFEVVAAVDNDPSSAWTYMHNLGTYPCQFHFVNPKDEKGLEKMLSKQLGLSETEGFKPFGVSGSGWISHEPADTPGVKHFFLGDVRKLTGRDILGPLDMKPGELDYITGGPPCQGFSTAGKRNIADPRSNLVFEFARLICEIRPKSICFENVPGIVSMVTPDGLPVLDTFCRILEDGGFGGYKMFKKSMEAQGVVGLMRSKPSSTKKPKRKKAKKKEKTLFDK